MELVDHFRTAGSVAILALGITGVGITIISLRWFRFCGHFFNHWYCTLKKLVTKIKKYERLIQLSKSSYLTINGIMI